MTLPYRIEGSPVGADAHRRPMAAPTNAVCHYPDRPGGLSLHWCFRPIGGRAFKKRSAYALRFLFFTGVPA